MLQRTQHSQTSISGFLSIHFCFALAAFKSCVEQEKHALSLRHCISDYASMTCERNFPPASVERGKLTNNPLVAHWDPKLFSHVIIAPS